MQIGLKSIIFVLANNFRKNEKKKHNYHINIYRWDFLFIAFL